MRFTYSGFLDKEEHSPVLHHCALTGVIARENQIQPPSNFSVALSGTGAAENILSRIVGRRTPIGFAVPGIIASGHARLGTRSPALEMRFMLDHAEDQIRIQTKPRTVAANQVVDSAVAGAPAAFFPPVCFVSPESRSSVRCDPGR